MLAVLPERVQATVGRKVCGIVDLDLADDGRVEVHLVQPEGLAQLTIGDDFPSPFPGLV